MPSGLTPWTVCCDAMSLSSSAVSEEVEPWSDVKTLLTSFSHDETLDVAMVSA